MSVEDLKQYLDGKGLEQVWAAVLSNFVKKEQGKGLIESQLIEKLNGIADGAQVNVIESVKVNGVNLEVTEKGVNIEVPTGTLAKLNSISENELSEELKTLINGKVNKASSLSGYGITDAYTKEETTQAIDTAVSRLYKFMGTCSFAELSLDGKKIGYTYNVTDAFVTTDAFLEGAGKNYPAGTNVAVVEEDGVLKWDALAGIFDFSEFVLKSEIGVLTEEQIAAICVMPE